MKPLYWCKELTSCSPRGFGGEWRDPPWLMGRATSSSSAAGQPPLERPRDCVQTAAQQGHFFLTRPVDKEGKLALPPWQSSDPHGTHRWGAQDQGGRATSSSPCISSIPETFLAFLAFPRLELPKAVSGDLLTVSHQATIPVSTDVVAIGGHDGQQVVPLDLQVEVQGKLPPRTEGPFWGQGPKALSSACGTEGGEGVSLPSLPSAASGFKVRKGMGRRVFLRRLY